MTASIWKTLEYWQGSNKQEGIPWLLKTLEEQRDIEDPVINAWMLVAKTTSSYNPTPYLKEQTDRFKTIVSLVQEHAQWLNDHPNTFERIAAAIEFDAPRIQAASISTKGTLALKLIQLQHRDHCWPLDKQHALMQHVLTWINDYTKKFNDTYPDASIAREDLIVLFTHERLLQQNNIPTLSNALNTGRELQLGHEHHRQIALIDALVDFDPALDKQYPYMAASLKLYSASSDGTYQQHNQWMERHQRRLEDTALAISKAQSAKPERAPSPLLYLIASMQYPLYTNINGAIQTLRDVSNTLTTPEVWSSQAIKYTQSTAWLNHGSPDNIKYILWSNEVNDLRKLQTLLQKNQPQKLPDLGSYELA